MNITPQIKEIIEYAQRKIKRATNEEIRLYPMPATKTAWFDIHQLRAIICSVVGVDEKDVLSGWRKEEVVLARHLIWYYGSVYKLGSLNTLAASLKAINHTSPLHAVSKIKALLEVGDEKVYNAVRQINALLEAMRPKEPVEMPF